MRTFAVIMIGCILAILVLNFMPSCVEEDSTMCIWNARKQGNGIGQSFITLWDGFTVYIGGKS